MPATPKHEQIAADIRERVGNGALKPGDQLPTKQQHADEWGCSVQPVTTAITRLEMEGLVIRRQGVGIFIAEPPA
jgi:DNA-binding GntR family transcriptional regulator